MEQLPQIVSGINGNDQSRALECTKRLAALLSICEVFRTPDERYEIGLFCAFRLRYVARPLLIRSFTIVAPCSHCMFDFRCIPRPADFILLIFQRIQEAVIIPRIVNFLSSSVDNLPELQYEAARVVTFFAPGPRIAHTPSDSILHPDKMRHKGEVVTSGAINLLVQLLGSTSPPVQEQAVVALGTIASHNSQARDFLISAGVFRMFYENINDATPPGLIHKLVWAISIFCGHTHPRTQPPNYDVISMSVPKLAYLFFKSASDETTLYHVCVCWRHLLPGVVMEDSISAGLAKCLL